MKTYPINLLLKNKHCLIVGGGKVAVRKLTALLDSGALVSVVDPKPSNKMKLSAENGTITLHERKFAESDLNGMFLMYLATSDRALNRGIIELAKPRGILVCSVDANWNKGTFITPASINHNDITIAVSSQGVACRKTKLIKDNHVVLLHLGEEAFEISLFAHLKHMSDQLGSSPEPHPFSLGASRKTQCCCQVSFTGAGVAHEKQILPGVEVTP